MTKKKEIILQDMLNEIRSMYSSLYNQMSDLKEKLAEISEPEIPNTEYVTLTEDGCFVGGKPTTKYHDEDIYRPYLCVAYFKEARDIIRKEYGYELLELHCLQSSTEGEYAKTGNPIPDKDGTYAWVRAVYKDKEGKVVSSLWAFNSASGSASDCASDCAYDCGYYVRNYESLRAGLFGSVA